ncbi:MAG: T9SS type A sorting domain-containing protein [Bacteroidota bacterium]
MVDAGGKTVQAGSFGQVSAGTFSETLSVGSLIPGVYCLQVSSGTGDLVQKLVIQR